MLVAAWIAFLLVMLFVLGSAVGSFLNVCIVRLPQGRSLLRPPSSCGHCGTLIRLKDNIPLVSYWLLRGRCRSCKAPFSMRYFWVELVTGLLFAAVYHLEVGRNVHHFEVWAWYRDGYGFLEVGNFPPHSWPLFAVHALLVGFLIVAAMSGHEFGRVPWSVTVPGVLAGLTAAVLCPWPWPDPANDAVGHPSGQVMSFVPVRQPYSWGPHLGPMPAEGPWWVGDVTPNAGLYPWPVWGPLPDWLPPGGRLLGLATGLTGALAGAVLMGAARLAFNAGAGAAAVGWAETSLLATAGSFLGWQPVVAAGLVGIGPALLVAALRRRRGPVSFGIWLAAVVVAVCFGWYWVGPLVQGLFFNASRLALLAAGYAAALVLLAVYLRLGARRGSQPDHAVSVGGGVS